METLKAVYKNKIKSDQGKFLYNQNTLSNHSLKINLML